MISGGLEVVDGLLWEDEAVAPTKNATKYVKEGGFGSTEGNPKVKCQNELQLNLFKMATLGTEESGRCREV